MTVSLWRSGPRPLGAARVIEVGRFTAAARLIAVERSFDGARL
jgi:hypothetical protein